MRVAFLDQATQKRFGHSTHDAHLSQCVTRFAVRHLCEPSRNQRAEHRLPIRRLQRDRPVERTGGETKGERVSTCQSQDVLGGVRRNTECGQHRVSVARCQGPQLEAAKEAPPLDSAPPADRRRLASHDEQTRSESLARKPLATQPVFDQAAALEAVDHYELPAADA